MMKIRKCQVCGKDCRRKKVGSQTYSAVICLACHADGWRFQSDGNAYKQEKLPIVKAHNHDTL